MGMLPMPKKLVKQGVRDMVRISDARMSGTSYGACILHVAPGAYVGGPLALVKTGDIISIDIPARGIRLEVPDEELVRGRAALTRPVPRYERGYGWMFSRHIRQAHEGRDFDFLRDELRSSRRRAGDILNGGSARAKSRRIGQDRSASRPILRGIRPAVGLLVGSGTRPAQ
jgi:hypothetical protein